MSQTKGPWGGLAKFASNVTIDGITVPFKKVPLELLEEIKARFPMFSAASDGQKVDTDGVSGEDFLRFQVATVMAATMRDASPSERMEQEDMMVEHGTPVEITTAFFTIMRASIPGFDAAFLKSQAAGPTAGAKTTTAGNRRGRKAGEAVARKASTTKSSGSKPRTSPRSPASKA